MGVEVRVMRRETKGGRSFGGQGAAATEREGRFAPFPPREFLGGLRGPLPAIARGSGVNAPVLAIVLGRMVAVMAKGRTWRWPRWD